MTDISDHSEQQTAFCAAINNVISAYSVSCTCTRKGYYTVHRDETGTLIAQPNIEFKCNKVTSDNGTVPENVVLYDLQMSFTIPTRRENGTELLKEEIKGFQCKTILNDGAESAWSGLALMPGG